jgi:RimJ/RimL family protein N-acetyltransferase
MAAYEANATAELFEEVLLALPDYNGRAKRRELAKHCPNHLRDIIEFDPDAVLVARVTESIGGFCFSEIDDGPIWMSWFGVRTEFRGQGIGNALIAAVVERARRANSKKVWCDCRTTNVWSKRILTRQGFRQLCTIERHWHDQDYILWEKLVS